MKGYQYENQLLQLRRSAKAVLSWPNVSKFQGAICVAKQYFYEKGWPTDCRFTGRPSSGREVMLNRDEAESAGESCLDRARRGRVN